MKKLSQKVFNVLKKKRLKISFAESCTGGLLSSTITSINGSSKVFSMGLVAYSNQSKINLLKVPKKTITKYGAVSYETCLHMVKNINKISKTHISVSITGIAGPGGGSADKPVGRVFISLAGPEGFSNTKKLNLRGSREEVRAQAALYALDLLRRALIRVAKKKR